MFSLDCHQHCASRFDGGCLLLMNIKAIIIVINVTIIETK